MLLPTPGELAREALSLSGFELDEDGWPELQFGGVYWVGSRPLLVLDEEGRLALTSGRSDEHHLGWCGGWLSLEWVRGDPLLVVEVSSVRVSPDLDLEEDEEDDPPLDAGSLLELMWGPMAEALVARVLGQNAVDLYSALGNPIREWGERDPERLDDLLGSGSEEVDAGALLERAAALIFDRVHGLSEDRERAASRWLVYDVVSDLRPGLDDDELVMVSIAEDVEGRGLREDGELAVLAVRGPAASLATHVAYCRGRAPPDSEVLAAVRREHPDLYARGMVVEGRDRVRGWSWVEVRPPEDG